MYRQIWLVTILCKIRNLPVVTKGFSWKDLPSWKREILHVIFTTMQLSPNLLFFIAFTVVDEINDEDTKTEEQTTVTKETEEEKLLEKAEESEDSGEMEIMTEEERIHKECEKVINTIRREEFGIGIELNEDGQRLKKVQDERLGRSLDRLSKDLYSKDTHFVLELIQNADDNDYPESMTKDGQNASVKFVVQTDGVIVLNNESGFLEKNIRALCDVGRSTKGKHKFGYIGRC